MDAAAVETLPGQAAGGAASRCDLLCVVGARPNFMKIAPVMRALRTGGQRVRLVHTGQHYDPAMNQQFFDQLEIPPPDVELGVGSGSHAVQTAEVMRRFEPVLDEQRPQAVMVVGDVNSTIACALVAVKKGVAVFHVEAGLRSFDRAMPEEINRVLTDQLSDLLFTTEPGALDNLVREGIDPSRVYFAGNVMIDTLHASRRRAIPAGATLARAGAAGVMARGDAPFGLLTLHRPSNVDRPETLRRLLGLMVEIGADLPIVFPIHPRTRARISAAGLDHLLEAPRILALAPLGYLEILGLMERARVVMTDSGGMQEETTALGVPCLTLRENTERPATVELGTNLLVGTDPKRIRDGVYDVLRTGGKAGRIPELWDGHAAERIADRVTAWFQAAASR